MTKKLSDERLRKIVRGFLPLNYEVVVRQRMRRRMRLAARALWRAVHAGMGIPQL